MTLENSRLYVHDKNDKNLKNLHYYHTLNLITFSCRPSNDEFKAQYT